MGMLILNGAALKVHQAKSQVHQHSLIQEDTLWYWLRSRVIYACQDELQ